MAQITTPFPIQSCGIVRGNTSGRIRDHGDGKLERNLDNEKNFRLLHSVDCRFSFVFPSQSPDWHVVALEQLHELNIHGYMYFNKWLPVLLVPIDDISELRRNVYFLTDGVVHNLRLPAPCAIYKRCYGSSHGWLVTIDGLSSVKP
ncbi:hypothetical protein Ancab_009769 [Ancistrocladus abbreviatus]